MQHGKSLKDKRRATKSAIAAATMELLCTMDYEKVTIREIARKAKVTPSNIYKHFDNKDVLVSGLYADIVDEMINGLNSCTEGIDDTRSKIRKVSYFYMQYYEDNPHIAMIMYGRNILRNWVESEESFRRSRQFGQVFVKILQTGQERGDVRRDINVRVMNWIFHGGMRHMVLSWLYRGHSFRLTEAAEGFAESIYAAICPPAEAFVCPYLDQSGAGIPSRKVVVPTGASGRGMKKD
jgi:TetR/AcrR family transcriptional regulator, fatty acid metabolism regulator protein